MNLLFKLVPILFFLTLTACGGGGGGSDDDTSGSNDIPFSIDSPVVLDGQLFVAKDGRYSLYYPDDWSVFVNLGGPGEVDDTILFHPPHSSPDITLSEKVAEGVTIASLRSQWNNFGYVTSIGNVGDYDYVIAKKNTQLITATILQVLLPSETDQDRVLTFEIPSVGDEDLAQLQSIIETVMADVNVSSPDNVVLTVLADGVPLAGTLSQGGVWQFALSATPNAVITLSVGLTPSPLSQAVTLNEFRPDDAIEVLSNNRFRFTPTDEGAATLALDSFGYGIALGDIVITEI